MARLDPAYPLDADVAATKVTPQRPWDVAAILAVLVVAGIEINVSFIAPQLHLTGPLSGLFGLVAEALIGVLVIGIAVAARIGGDRPWHRALGLGWLRPSSDRALLLRWALVQFGVRIVAAISLVVLIPGLDRQVVSNNPLRNHPSLITSVIVGVAAVVVAPVSEEILCRGLLLRAAMRRWGFLPAAVISSALFGLAHAYQQPTIAAGMVAAAVLGLFGFVQALLVRRTGRLELAIGVHAVSNGWSLLLAL